MHPSPLSLIINGVRKMVAETLVFSKMVVKTLIFGKMMVKMVILMIMMVWLMEELEMIKF